MKNKKALFISLAAVICIVAIVITVFAISSNTGIFKSGTANSRKSGTSMHEKISTYAETHNDTFSKNYAGIYFDNSGKLNILLTDKTDECNNFILETFGYENPCKTTVEYSYKELTSEQNKINKKIDKKKNKSISAVDAITSVSLNVLDNRISVTLYTKSGESDNELISQFKDEISDSEMITFEFTNEKSVSMN